MTLKVILYNCRGEPFETIFTVHPEERRSRVSKGNGKYPSGHSSPDRSSPFGSTAIKQAQAKNIVDLQILIASFDDFDELKKVLETLGFQYLENIKQDHVPFKEANYFESGWEKRFFTGMYNGQKYNIHIRLTNSKNAKFAVNFVNLLENNSDAKFAYLQFKARLAKAGVSQEDYCLVKDSVIDIISLLYT